MLGFSILSRSGEYKSTHTPTRERPVWGDQEIEQARLRLMEHFSFEKIHPYLVQALTEMWQDLEHLPEPTREMLNYINFKLHHGGLTSMSVESIKSLISMTQDRQTLFLQRRSLLKMVPLMASFAVIPRSLFSRLSAEQPNRESLRNTLEFARELGKPVELMRWGKLVLWISPDADLEKLDEDGVLNITVDLYNNDSFNSAPLMNGLSNTDLILRYEHAPSDYAYEVDKASVDDILQEMARISREASTADFVSRFNSEFVSWLKTNFGQSKVLITGYSLSASPLRYLDISALANVEIIEAAPAGLEDYGKDPSQIFLRRQRGAIQQVEEGFRVLSKERPEISSIGGYVAYLEEEYAEDLDALALNLGMYSRQVLSERLFKLFLAMNPYEFVQTFNSSVYNPKEAEKALATSFIFFQWKHRILFDPNIPEAQKLEYIVNKIMKDDATKIVMDAYAASSADYSSMNLDEWKSTLCSDFGMPEDVVLEIFDHTVTLGSYIDHNQRKALEAKPQYDQHIILSSTSDTNVPPLSPQFIKKMINEALDKGDDLQIVYIQGPIGLESRAHTLHQVVAISDALEVAQANPTAHLIIMHVDAEFQTVSERTEIYTGEEGRWPASWGG